MLALLLLSGMGVTEPAVVSGVIGGVLGPASHGSVEAAPIG